MSLKKDNIKIITGEVISYKALERADMKKLDIDINYNFIIQFKSVDIKNKNLDVRALIYRKPKVGEQIIVAVCENNYGNLKFIRFVDK